MALLASEPRSFGTGLGQQCHLPRALPRVTFHSRARSCPAPLLPTGTPPGAPGPELESELLALWLLPPSTSSALSPLTSPPFCDRAHACLPLQAHQVSVPHRPHRPCSRPPGTQGRWPAPCPAEETMPSSGLPEPVCGPRCVLYPQVSPECPL